MRAFALRHVPFLALFAYSLHGVGLCCDDFDLLVTRARDPWFRYLLANPANIPTHGLPLLWIGYDQQALYDLLKFGWVAAAYGMAYRFGSLFFAAPRAALFAALQLMPRLGRLLAPGRPRWWLAAGWLPASGWCRRSPAPPEASPPQTWFAS